MSEKPWHKRYHSDALTGYQSLTLEERGAYTTILDLLYDRGDALNLTDRLLAGHLNSSVRKARTIVNSLIAKGKLRRLEDGRLTNSRFEKEKIISAKTPRKRAENEPKTKDKPDETAEKTKENKDGGTEKQHTYQRPDTRDQIVREAEREPARPEHRDQAKAALAHGREVLTDWEKQFLGSLLTCRTLSRSQREKFSAIREKLAEVAGHDGTERGEWAQRLAWARENRQWSYRAWGPWPHKPGCKVPADMLLPTDGEGWPEWKATA